MVWYITSTLGEHCVPGPLPMQLDKSKEWTGGVGMVLEWYYEMMPSGHVASLALHMGRKRVYVSTAARAMNHWHCPFLPKWIRMSGLWVRPRLEHFMTNCMTGEAFRGYMRL